MIFVTKDEADYLRQNIKNVKIFKTCRLKNNGSNRGKRYAEETSAVVNLLCQVQSRLKNILQHVCKGGYIPLTYLEKEFIFYDSNRRTSNFHCR